MAKNVSLMVRLDQDSKDLLTAAAELRSISVSDYVRSVTVGQAAREIAAANENTIAMSADEQLEFWNALNQPAQVSPAQRELGKLMRGEL
ncbi:MAG TPA: hypothetical protein DDW52_13800 [Planctomycetaceae bacterium]|nr:hypothetical protein [Planctomycetaceae bacterium]